MAAVREELTTQQWVQVMRQAREMGAAQLGFSGGEPLVRRDLEELVAEGRELGYYTNLITSGIGLDAGRVAALKVAGLDHIQLSFQSSSEELSATMSGSGKAFGQKLAIAEAVKAQGYPMVLLCRAIVPEACRWTFPMCVNRACRKSGMTLRRSIFFGVMTGCKSPAGVARRKKKTSVAAVARHIC